MRDFGITPSESDGKTGVINFIFVPALAFAFVPVADDSGVVGPGGCILARPRHFQALYEKAELRPVIPELAVRVSRVRGLVDVGPTHHVDPGLTRHLVVCRPTDRRVFQCAVLAH